VRGTDCYLAPEVLGSQKFNNRSDMFALGCILFQCVAGRELFPNSWAIQMYAQDTNVLPGKFAQFWPETTHGSRLKYLQDLATDLLSVEPTSRPGAAETLNRIQDIRWHEPHSPTIQESNTDVDEFFSIPDRSPAEDEYVRVGFQDSWSGNLGRRRKVALARLSV
jgi:serine/threonine protein kinase